MIFFALNLHIMKIKKVKKKTHNLVVFINIQTNEMKSNVTRQNERWKFRVLYYRYIKEKEKKNIVKLRSLLCTFDFKLYSLFLYFLNSIHFFSNFIFYFFF